MQSGLQKKLVTRPLKQMFGDGDVREERKLHLGCATLTPSGWINLDGSWNAWLAKHSLLRSVLGFCHVIPPEKAAIQWSKDILIHDLRNGLPFPDDYLTAIYASHLLEHLYLKEAKNLLRECFRALQPGGVVRLVVPDLHSIVLEYMNKRELATQSKDGKTLSPGDRLCQSLDLRPESPLQGNLFYRLYTIAKDFHSHKWMYDSQSLMGHLSEAGFIDVSEKQFLESKILGIGEVEKEDRLGHRGICVEAVKPQWARS